MVYHSFRGRRRMDWHQQRTPPTALGNVSFGSACLGCNDWFGGGKMILTYKTFDYNRRSFESYVTDGVLGSYFHQAVLWQFSGVTAAGVGISFYSTVQVDISWP